MQLVTIALQSAAIGYDKRGDFRKVVSTDRYKYRAPLSIRQFIRCKQAVHNKKVPRQSKDPKEPKKGRPELGPPGDHDDEAMNDAMDVDPLEPESDMECAEVAAAAEKKTTDAAADAV